MTRSIARMVWVASLVFLSIGILALYKWGQSITLAIQTQQLTVEANRAELENTSRLSTALTELDRLTINENIATQLEILRHLGLEQDDYNVSIGLKSQVGSAVSLLQRQIKLAVELPYAEAMNLIDRFYAERKMNLTAVKLNEADPKVFKSEVRLEVEGIMYSIDKRGGRP